MVWLRTLSLALFATLACQAAFGETLLLEFTTQSCGPCRQMRPVMQQLAAEGYAVREIDATRHPQAVADYRVSGFPTFVVLVYQREYAGSQPVRQRPATVAGPRHADRLAGS
jgi:thiol-disulfide isomerase/thioredoxin